jgi:hypothetical protein
VRATASGVRTLSSKDAVDGSVASPVEENAISDAGLRTAADEGTPELVGFLVRYLPTPTDGTEAPSPELA